MRLMPVLLFLFSLSALANQALANSSDDAEVMRKTQLQLLQINANNFCNSIKLRSYVEDSTKNKSLVRQMSDSDVIKLAMQLEAKDGTQDSSYSFGGDFETIPLVDIRSGMARDNILLPGLDSRGLDNTTSLQKALDMAVQAMDSSPCLLQDHVGGESFEELKADSGLDVISGDDSADETPMEKMVAKLMPTAVASVCAELAPLQDSFACSKAVLHMQDKMRQRDNLISMPDLLDKIINSGAFDQGLKLAANIIIANARHPDQVKSNLFADIKTAFQQAGYNAVTAEEMTFDVLGMVATGGPAMSARLGQLNFSHDRWPVVTALTVVASLPQYIDFYTGQEGHIYSLPAGVIGSCDTSKTYYFWMSAYLARSAAQEGLPPQTAAVAAYSACKGYHVFGNMTNRDGSELFTEDTFSPESDVNRVDLVYASSGALFGAGMDLSKPLSVDSGLAVSIQNSKFSPAMTDGDAQKESSSIAGRFGYSIFLSKFAVNTVFKYQAQGRSFTSPPSLANMQSGVSKPLRCQ